LSGQADTARTTDSAVLANRLRIAGNWGEPCLAYLLFFQPDPDATVAFGALQDILLGLEPSLLRQPAHALHVSSAFLVPVSGETDLPKDEIWQARGADWVRVIAGATAAMTPFRLRFSRLMVTDAAVIAVADQPNPISELRRVLTAALDLPWPITKGELVHTTLFRFSAALADPARLLRRAGDLETRIETGVPELQLVRETTFPSLNFEVLHRFALGKPSP